MEEFHSPYNYGPNSPTKRVDTNGRKWEFLERIYNYVYHDEFVTTEELIMMQAMENEGEFKFEPLETGSQRFERVRTTPVIQVIFDNVYFSVNADLTPGIGSNLN